MTWEYLSTEIFQTRFGIVAAYLADKTRGKIILDLNCGAHAGLLKQLRKDFSLYVGNDKLLPDNHDAEKVCLVKMDDAELLAYLKTRTERLDVFVHIGHGGGKITGEKAESNTDIDSGKAIISHFLPTNVILECVNRFTGVFLSEYAGFLGGINYERVHQLRLTIDDEKKYFMNDRVFNFYTRQP